MNANVGGVKTLFKANGVEFLHGEASFQSPTEIDVKAKTGSSDADCGTQRHHRYRIRAGRREGVAARRRNDHQLRRRRQARAHSQTLLVVGGGVIGLEFATVYTRMGAKVLVVEMMPQILTGTDLEIGKTLGRILKKQGIEIMLDTKVGQIEKTAQRRARDVHRRGTGG